MSSSSDTEQERLAAVHALQWLETAGSENFDRICRLAATYFRVPTVLISLVERERQWFAGRVGFAASQTPIEQSFCRYTIEQPGVMQILDAKQDPRFAKNPLVTAPAGICFYAGAPLRDHHGRVLGSLCLIDSETRQLDDDQVTVLQDFAEMVMVQIEQRQLLKYRHPVSGLPNLQQFLRDTQVLSLAEGMARLIVMVQLQEEPSGGQLSQERRLDAQISQSCELATNLRRRLDGVAELYHIGDRDFCVHLSCEAKRHPELFCVLLALISESFVDQVVRVGLAVCENGEQTAATLVRKATYAVGLANYGHSLWAAYDDTLDCAQRRAFTLLADLNDALAGGDVYLEYQPRFSVQDGRLISAEALIRWRHPTLGKLSPAEFIPLIERSGRISTVTRWVIDRALQDLSVWSDVDIRLSVNLSAQDFQNMDIAQTLRDTCEQYAVSPRRLEVEITEGEWIRADNQVISQLTAIRALGIDVAIDDFGTGYSNFAYLHEIPANILKLDKSLVTDLENNSRNRTITRSVLQLAQELGYRTVAEGIETFRCLSLVHEYGCHEAQGYFLSRPLGIDHFKRHWADIALTFNPDLWHDSASEVVPLHV